MGLESLSATNLKGNRKGFNSPDRYAHVVQRLHEHGIALQGCFVFGLDDDRPDVFLRTAEFAVQAKIDLPRFAVVTPFPNTPLYKRLDAEGRILTKNWELYDAQHVVFQPKHLSVQELQLGIESAWKHAYSYRSIWQRIRSSPAPWPVRLGTNLGSITATGSSAALRVMHHLARKRKRPESHDPDAPDDHPPLCRTETGAAVHQDVADGAPAGRDARRTDATDGRCQVLR
jgi:radical SAM superfamily enzyme YgiQ (UPF0313 family)